MKRKTWLVPALLAGCLLGCARPTPTTKAKATDEDSGSRGPDVAKIALEALGRGIDAAQIRDPLFTLTAQMRDPAILKEMADLRANGNTVEFLKSEGNLSSDEIEEVDSSIFRPLDAYHLESCFQFRDAARGLEQINLPAPERAVQALGWVSRRVLLGGPQGQSWIPPHLILRSGFGSPSDRALVFLSLLRQMQPPIDGVVLGSPHPLVALQFPGEEHKDKLYVFDMTMGTPVPGPDGKTLVTLAELRERPELLKAAGISADDFKSSEYYLNCPLTALASRMKILQDMLKKEPKDQISLYMDARQIHKNLAAAAKVPIRPCNPDPTEAGEARNSPTRSQRCFVYPDQGGRPSEKNKVTVEDAVRTLRFNQYQQSWLHMPQVETNMRNLRLLDDTFLPQAAAAKVREDCLAVVMAFSAQPRDMLVRGHMSALLKRLERGRNVLDEVGYARDEADFHVDLTAWRNLAKDAYLAQARNDPNANNMLNLLWGDQYFQAVMDLGVEIDNKRFNEQPKNSGPKQFVRNKKFLTFLVFSICKDALDPEVAYLTAAQKQEVAENMQASVEAGRSQNFAAAQQEWSKSQRGWSRYLEGNLKITPATVKERVALIQQTKDRPLLQYLLREWSMSCQARLNLARSRQLEGQPKAALVILESLAQDLDTLAGDTELQKGLDAILVDLRAALNRAQSEGVILNAAIIHDRVRLMTQEFRGGTLAAFHQQTRSQMRGLAVK